MALIEEVWGSLTPSSPPEPKVEKKDNNTTDTDSLCLTSPVEQNKALVNSKEIKETFMAGHKKDKHASLALFLALVVTGCCSLYAMDMFTTVIRKS